MIIANGKRRFLFFHGILCDITKKSRGKFFIIVPLNTRVAQKNIHYNSLKFLGTVNHAVAFQCSKLMVFCFIRNCIAYANETNILNKDSPTRIPVDLRHQDGVALLW